MSVTAAVQKILATRQQVATSLSLSDRTVDAIPEELLPIVRVGRAVRYRICDVEHLAERLANGEVSVGPVNG